ncbi:hypothetical protein ACH5RR_025938 [Cinchona calisaya]|uniref:Uncharacterized protein n=1 Tax=Cinchona calisaya TaxID=153742 RepID=A0ABD2Z315_9GENT
MDLKTKNDAYPPTPNLQGVEPLTEPGHPVLSSFEVGGVSDGVESRSVMLSSSILSQCALMFFLLFNCLLFSVFGKEYFFLARLEEGKSGS